MFVSSMRGWFASVILLCVGCLCLAGVARAQPITGVWTGSFSLHMRVAETGIVLGNSVGNYWIWNFDEGWAQFGETDPGETGQGMLSVGFPFHVQDLGNESAEHDRAYFMDHGDGTYTLYHGYQIYNPYVGNPRTDMETVFRITRDGDRLLLETTDPDGDGVPGWPVPGVFPLTVSPGFDGVLVQDDSGAGVPTDPQEQVPGADMIGLFTVSSPSVTLGESVTLTWQAVRATSCVAQGAWQGIRPTVGSVPMTPEAAGIHTYSLLCSDGTTSMTKSVVVDVQEPQAEEPQDPEPSKPADPTDPNEPTDPVDPDDPLQPGASGLTGVYVGEHLITMRGCPGDCARTGAVVLGTGMTTSPWVWDFDNRTVLITGTTLTVGFNYEVQSVGNVGEGDARLTAAFTDNGDGTYTLHHGFQIYNPNVGNPRADTTTKFWIAQDPANPNNLVIETLDDEPRSTLDGIAGTQIVGVFPMTVQPEFKGSARRQGSSSAGDGVPDDVKLGLGLNPDAANGDTDGDGIVDAVEMGADWSNPLDSDGDGVIDALEPGQAAEDPRHIAGLALLGGIPGYAQEGLALAGTVVEAGIGEDWLFTAAETGLLQMTTNEDNAGAIPDTTLGDAGLDYRHGFVQLAVRYAHLLPSFGADAAHSAYAPLAEAVATPLTLRLRFEAELPPASTLLLYGTEWVDGKARYTLMARGDWVRVDAHTLEVSVLDNGLRDLDGTHGMLRMGFAPVANTLGGDPSGGTGGEAVPDSDSGSGGSFGVLALLLGLLAFWRGRPRAMAAGPTVHRKKSLRGVR